MTTYSQLGSHLLHTASRHSCSFSIYQVLAAEEELMKEKGGVVGSRLLIGNVEFSIGDGAANRAVLPKGTQRKYVTPP